MKLTKELLTAIQNDNPAILHLLEEAESIVKEALDAKRANLANAIYAYIGRQDEKLAKEVFSLLDCGHAQITPLVNSTEEKCKCEGKCSHEKPKVVKLTKNEADEILEEFLKIFK